MSTVLLEVVTPEKKVYAEEVEMVSVKGVDGELGILPNHVPLVTELKIAPLRAKQGELVRHIALSGGFIEVRKEHVVVLAESAEFPENINIDRAQAAKDRAERRLRERQDEVDYRRAELALQRALTRIEVYNNFQR